MRFSLMHAGSKSNRIMMKIDSAFSFHLFLDAVFDGAGSVLCKKFLNRHVFRRQKMEKLITDVIRFCEKRIKNRS